MIYILGIYDEDDVQEGGKPWDEDSYTHKSKKNYIVWDVIYTTALLFLYGYFLYFVMSNNSQIDKWQEENPASEEGDDEEKEPMMEMEAEM